MPECLRTERIEVKPNRNLSKLCHLTKNLSNAANYEIRQLFFNKKPIPTYYKLCKMLQQKPEYKDLPGHTAQQTLKNLAKNWTSFIKSNQEFNKNPKKFFNKPRIPDYRKTNGEHLAIFTANQVRLMENGYLKFPKLVNFAIKTRLSKETKIQQVRIIPKGVGYRIEIVYRRVYSTKRLQTNRKAAIDFGVVNIITMVDNIGSRPIVVKDDGKGLKSITQFYMKERAKLQKIYENQSIKSGGKLRKLIFMFELRKLDQLHKISKFIVKECVSRKIGTLVIGYNPKWKQSIRLGKKANQTFVNLPFNQLIEKIRYKAEEKGIQIELIDESYTSKCSFLDDKQIRKLSKYKGKRVTRGLFQAYNGCSINADVNAAYNILVKSDPYAIPSRSASGVGGYVVYPFCWKID